MGEDTFTREFFVGEGRKGGRKSSDAMTKKARTKRAKKAAQARWRKKKA